MEVFSNAVTNYVSSKIHQHLKQVHRSLEPFNSSKKPTPTEAFIILEEVSLEMPKLFKLLSDSFKSSDNTAAEALKKTFYVPGSEQKAKLFAILAYTYSIILEIQKNTSYPLISDDKHIEYARKVIQFNESGLGNFV